MALEPALALLIGFVVLHQVPRAPAIVGIGLVVGAGIGAARSGGRTYRADAESHAAG
jgi:inner membrane transporter RhtA